MPPSKCDIRTQPPTHAAAAAVQQRGAFYAVVRVSPTRNICRVHPSSSTAVPGLYPVYHTLLFAHCCCGSKHLPGSHTRTFPNKYIFVTRLFAPTLLCAPCRGSKHAPWVTHTYTNNHGCAPGWSGKPTQSAIRHPIQNPLFWPSTASPAPNNLPRYCCMCPTLLCAPTLTALCSHTRGC